MLKRTIEQDSLLQREYDVFVDILQAISDLLSQHQIDTRELAGVSLGIIKILDGPLYNQLEEDLVNLAGDVGLLIRRLKQGSKF